MIEVKIREHEPFEVAYRRFKRLVDKDEILADIRKKEFYVKPSRARKEKWRKEVKK